MGREFSGTTVGHSKRQWDSGQCGGRGAARKRCGTMGGFSCPELTLPFPNKRKFYSVGSQFKRVTRGPLQCPPPPPSWPPGKGTGPSPATHSGISPCSVVRDEGLFLRGLDSRKDVSLRPLKITVDIQRRTPQRDPRPEDKPGPPCPAGQVVHSTRSSGPRGKWGRDVCPCSVPHATHPEGHLLPASSQV